MKEFDMKQLKTAILTIALFCGAQTIPATHEHNKEVFITHDDDNITITYDNKQADVTLEQLKLSGTFRYVAEDCNVNVDCTEQIETVIKSFFPVYNPTLRSEMIPVLKLLPYIEKINKAPSEEEKEIAQAELTQQLEPQTNEQLISIMKTANYLDVPILIDAAAQTIAEKISTPEALNDFKKDKEAFLRPFKELSNEIEVIITKKIYERYKDIGRSKLIHKKFTNPIVLISPDSELIIMDSLNKNRYICSTTDGKQLYNLQKPILPSRFSPDGNYLAAYVKNKTNIYDAKTGAHLWTADFTKFQFSPNGEYIMRGIKESNPQHLLAGNSGRTYIYKTINGEFVRSLDGFDPTFSPNGNYITTKKLIVNDALPPFSLIKAYVYKAHNGVLLHILNGDLPKFSSNEKFITIIKRNEEQTIDGQNRPKPIDIEVYDVDTGKHLHNLGLNNRDDAGRLSLGMYTLNSNNKIIIPRALHPYSHFPDAFLIYNVTTGDYVTSLYESSLIHSPNGNMITSKGNNTYIYCNTTGKILHELHGSYERMSPDGRYIITSIKKHTEQQRDPKVKCFIYDSTNGTLLHILNDTSRALFSRDGKYLVINDNCLINTSSLKKMFKYQPIESAMNDLSVQTNDSFNNFNWKITATSTAAAVGLYIWYKWASK
jgi:hypothetical protein